MWCSQTKAPWIEKRCFPKNLASVWWNLHQAHPTTQHTTYEAPLPQHKWHAWVEGSRFCWPFLDHQGSDREQPSKSRTAQRNAQAVPLLPLWRAASAPRDQPPTANAAKTPMCPRTPPTPSRLQRSSWKGTGHVPAWYPWTPHRLRKEVHSAMIGCRASPQANGIEGWSKVISRSLLPSSSFPLKRHSEVNHHFGKITLKPNPQSWRKKQVPKQTVFNPSTSLTSPSCCAAILKAMPHRCANKGAAFSTMRSSNCLATPRAATWLPATVTQRMPGNVEAGWRTPKSHKERRPRKACLEFIAVLEDCNICFDESLVCTHHRFKRKVVIYSPISTFKVVQYRGCSKKQLDIGSHSTPQCRKCVLVKLVTVDSTWRSL